jgi:hypothetical protein
MEQTGKPSLVHISEAIKVKVENNIKSTQAQTVEYQGSSIKTYFVDEIVFDPVAKAKADREKQSGQGGRRKSSVFLMLSEALSRSTRMLALAGGKEGGKKTSNHEVQKSQVVGHEDDEYLESYMPATGRDPRIGTWLSFVDSNLETEYQAAYITKCTGKIATSMAFTTFMTFILVLIDFVAYFQEPAVWIVKFTAMLVEFALFNLIIAKYDDAVGKGKWETLWIKWSRSLNYQYVGPFVILLLFITTVPQLTISAGVMGLMAYHYATLHITIMMSAVFDRLRSLHINAATYAVVVMILANLNGNFFAGNEEDRHLAVTTWGFLILMSLALSWITWRMEYQVRRNYLMKRELAERRFEIEDIRVKTEKMLYTLLPKEIVMRYVYLLRG